MDTINLYHGDCLDILPSIGPVDTVITDPIWPNVPADMFPFCTDPYALLRDALEKITARRVVIILRNDSDPRFMTAVPDRWPYFRMQILPYVLPGYIGRKLGGYETAYCFGEPLPSAPGRRVIPGMGPKAQPNSRKRNGHPCSRTLVHMRWLVNWWSLPGETVLDPFMGSGTTGVACVEMDRHFVGIEIQRHFFDLSYKRIHSAQTPLPMVFSTNSKSQQCELWAGQK